MENQPRKLSMEEFALARRIKEKDGELLALQCELAGRLYASSPEFLAEIRGDDLRVGIMSLVDTATRNAGV